MSDDVVRTALHCIEQACAELHVGWQRTVAGILTGRVSIYTHDRHIIVQDEYNCAEYARISLHDPHWLEQVRRWL